MTSTNNCSFREKPVMVPVFASADNVEGEWETSGYSNPAIPSTLSDLKVQIRISEEQMDKGQYVTVQKAIEHFYQL